VIPLHGWAVEFRAKRGGRPVDCWDRIRAELVHVKQELASQNRAPLAQALADLVAECCDVAVAHDIVLDDALREVHRARMTRNWPGGDVPAGYVRPNMADAIKKRGEVATYD
jgi:hypothetical protein